MLATNGSAPAVLLMNPRHPESAQARIARVHSYGIDLRLLR